MNVTEIMTAFDRANTMLEWIVPRSGAEKYDQQLIVPQLTSPWTPADQSLSNLS